MIFPSLSRSATRFRSANAFLAGQPCRSACVRPAPELAFSFFSLVSLFVGVFLAAKPQQAMKIQIKFYEKINWRVEPISIDKEIRNTRAMGVLLLVVFVVSLLYGFTH